MEAAGCYLTYVIEDVTKRLIVATATLLIERKFIHSCGTVCLALPLFPLPHFLTMTCVRVRGCGVA
jgi:hypothetical protein